MLHICQGGYVAMHEIELDGLEQNIFCNCVDGLWMGGKPDKSKEVEHSTVYRTDAGAMLKVLEVFHHWASRHIMGMTATHGVGGEC